MPSFGFRVYLCNTLRKQKLRGSLDLVVEIKRHEDNWHGQVLDRKYRQDICGQEINEDMKIPISQSLQLLMIQLLAVST